MKKLKEMDGGGATGNATGGIGGTGLGASNSYTQLPSVESFETPKKSKTKEYIEKKKKYKNF